RVLGELKRIERQTARPFVLLIYGDHQPWSFTGGVYSVAGGTVVEGGFSDFSRLRTSAPLTQTFFHLLASDKTILTRPFTKPAAATLLPTPASAYVAASYDDLYLPANFVAFELCGSDVRAGVCDRYPEIAKSWRD